MFFMGKILFFISLFTSTAFFAQKYQNQLEFSKELVDNKTYNIYVKNPSKQLRSFKLTIKGKNIETKDSFFKTDTISPETKRLLTVIKKEKKKQDAIIGFNWVEAVGSLHVRKTLGHRYQLPYAKGQKFKVIQGYNELFSHNETFALDFEMPEGTPVHAIRSGQIFDIKLDGNQACEEPACERYSNYIYVLHYDGTVALYKSLMPNCTDKVIGDFINVGERIAYSGFTGQAKAPHLHVEVQILNRDLSGYKSSPIEFSISKMGKSDVLNKNDEYLRY